MQIEWVYSNDQMMGATIKPSGHFMGRNVSETELTFKRRVLSFKRELEQAEKMVDVINCEGM